MKHGAVAERIDPRVIFARDGGICWLCGAPVDSELRGPDPLSAALAHIVLLVAGGAHVAANVRLAHRRCLEVYARDVRRGSRVSRCSTDHRGRHHAGGKDPGMNPPIAQTNAKDGPARATAQPGKRIEAEPDEAGALVASGAAVPAERGALAELELLGSQELRKLLLLVEEARWRRREALAEAEALREQVRREVTALEVRRELDGADVGKELAKAEARLVELERVVRAKRSAYDAEVERTEAERAGCAAALALAEEREERERRAVDQAALLSACLEALVVQASAAAALSQATVAATAAARARGQAAIAIELLDERSFAIFRGLGELQRAGVRFDRDRQGAWRVVTREAVSP